MADDPTPGELGRLFQRLSDQLGELNKAINGLVRKDVFDALHAQVVADIKRLEAEQREFRREYEDTQKDRVKERSENRRMIWTAVLACVSLAVGTIIATWALK